MKREVDHGPYWITFYLEAFLSLPRLLLAFFPAMLLGVVAALPLFLLGVIGVIDRSSGAAFLDLVFDLVILFTVLIAVAPVVASVLTLYLVPGGYGLTRWELDAEEPSARQHDLLVDSLRRVTANAPAGAIGPSKWLVLDKNDPNAFVIGTTIYVHRGLITSEYLDPVIAHELGHLNHGDGRLALALRRLVPPPLSYIEFEEMGCLPLTVMGFNGGLGLLVTGWLWNRHWQRRELLADRFAYECGQATGLIEILDLYGFFDVAVPFGALRRDHPHNETRVDELMRLLREEDDGVIDSAGTARPAARTLAQKVTETKRGRKQGHADEESVLNLTILDEAHGSLITADHVAADQEWIQAFRKELTDLAQWGNRTRGRGYLISMYTPGSSDELIDNVSYHRHEDFATIADHSQAVLGAHLDELDRDLWDKRIATYDPERTFVLAIGVKDLLGELLLRIYLVGRSGGGKLPVTG